MDFFKKIQNLPMIHRKIILWALVIIIGIIFFAFWMNYSKKKIKSFDLQSYKEKLKPPANENPEFFPKYELPEIEMPELTPEQIKELEEELSKEKQN